MAEGFNLSFGKKGEKKIVDLKTIRGGIRRDEVSTKGSNTCLNGSTLTKTEF